MKIIKTLALAVATLWSPLGIWAATSTSDIRTCTVDGVTYKYRVVDGCAEITGESLTSPAISRDTSGVLEIPATLDGYQVTRIGENAFVGCSKITEVVFPMEDDSPVTPIVFLGENAFRNCGGLTSISLPDGVKEINHNVFYGCSALQTAEIAGTVSSVECRAFQGCSELWRVTLAEGIQAIGESTFSGCKQLTEITIPSGVVRIGASAFANSGLTEITFAGPPPQYTMTTWPSGTTGWYGQKYKSQWGKELGSSDEWHGLSMRCKPPYGYVVKNGEATLVANDQTKDIEGNLVIPANVDGYPVTGIGEGAFASCLNLTSVWIEDGVKILNHRVFAGCTKLKVVSIAGSVASVGCEAFRDCMALDDVYLQEGVEVSQARSRDPVGLPRDLSENDREYSHDRQQYKGDQREP